jgi:hypothetical protein
MFQCSTLCTVHRFLKLVLNILCYDISHQLQSYYFGSRNHRGLLQRTIIPFLLKGAVSRDFRPLDYSSNNSPGSPDSCGNSFNNDSYSRRYSTIKLDSAPYRIARKFFSVRYSPTLFYCHWV